MTTTAATMIKIKTTLDFFAGSLMNNADTRAPADGQPAMR